MAPSLHSRLLKCRRNAASAVASAAFLLLVLVLSVLLATARREGGDATWTTVFFSGAAPPAIAAAPSSSLLLGPGGQHAGEEEEGASTTTCEAALRSLPDHAARCRYLSQPGHPPCAPGAYVDYLRVFYCAFGHLPWLGAAAMALWLLVLFYLLGDTASRYFCASLAGLSEALRLPPAIAGATLLSLGNGAPDVLSSVVAFAGAGAGGGDAGDVGLSSVLGGALFVSTVVAGIVALVAASRGGEVVIERRGFVRDVCFLLVALCYLLAVLLAGTVTVWAAASFLSLYAAYVLVIWFSHCCAAAGEEEEDDELRLEDYGKKPAASPNNSDDVLAVPLLLDAYIHGETATPPLPVSINKSMTCTPPEKTFCQRAMDALQSPLYLPRRLTIPDIEPHEWSKRYAVASAFLSPLLLAAVSSPTNPVALLSAAGHTTNPTSPPGNPVRAPPVARGRVPDVGALVLPPGPRAGGPAGGDRAGGRREGERAGGDGAGVGELAGGPGGGRGDGHARRRRRGPDGGGGVLRGPGVQHGGGPGPVADDGRGGPVPAAVRDPRGRGGGVRGRGVPCGGAGVGARGAPRARDAARPGARGWAARRLPRVHRRQARLARRLVISVFFLLLITDY